MMDVLGFQEIFIVLCLDVAFFIK